MTIPAEVHPDKDDPQFVEAVKRCKAWGFLHFFWNRVMVTVQS